MEAESWQKEEISRAYLHAIAAREGCTIGDWRVDKDGVDATLRRRKWMIDVQLKCTQDLRVLGNSYAFDLDVTTYDKLREEDRSAPGYLFVMKVPKEIEDWIHLHPDEHLLLRCTAFYARIQDMPATKNQTSIVVHLPFENRLNGAALDDMFEHSRRHALGLREERAA
jgi:hypothetical protein